MSEKSVFAEVISLTSSFCMLWDEIAEKLGKLVYKKYKIGGCKAGHCLWVTYVPQAGIEDDASAQLAWWC